MEFLIILKLLSIICFCNVVFIVIGFGVFEVLFGGSVVMVYWVNNVVSLFVVLLI